MAIIQQSIGYIVTRYAMKHLREKIMVIIMALIPLWSFSQGSKALYSPEFYFRTGLEMIEKANFSDARASFRNFLLLAPYDFRKPVAEYYIAYSALNLYNLDAEQLFVDFIRNYPAHPKTLTAYYDLGSFFYQDKNYKDAVRYLSMVNFQQLTPEQQHETRFKLAYAYFSLRKFSDALTHFNILKHQNNSYTYPSAYYSAYIEYQNEEYELALNDLEIAANSDAYKSIVPYMVANIYYRQKRYSDLADYGVNALSTGAKLTNIRDIYLLTGEGFYQQNNFARASEYYQTYRKRFKGTPPADVVFRMAVTDFNLNNDLDAIRNLKLIAARKDSYGVAASFYLGWLYLRQDNLEFASAAFKIASDQTIDLEIAEKAAFEYAKVSVDLGRSSEAVRQLIKFISDFPDSPQLNDANDLLSIAYVNSNNPDLAIRHMESLPSMSFETKGAYQKATFMKANQLFNQRKYRDAVELYDKSLKYPINRDFVNQSHFWKGESFSVGRKYEEAIPEYLIVAGSGDTELKLKTQYGLGYCYFNTRDYNKALPRFRSFVDNFAGSKRNSTYQDALLRLADCYYATRDYSTAMAHYNDAISRGVKEKAYAFLQIGVLQRINGEVLSAKESLNRVINVYPESPYVDDALFEKASLDFERGNYQAAVGGFSDLITKKPASPFVPYAMQRRAIAHFNLKNYRRTEEDYKNFLKQFPGHNETNNILLGLQEVLAEQKKSHEFEQFLAAYKLANPDTEGLEVVEFESARTYYNSLEYDKAITAFTAFMQTYPEDHRVHDAKYYIAESYYRKREAFNALPLYYELLTENQITRIIRVIQRIADLEYEARNYPKAISYYRRLESNAFTKRQLFNAWTGLMKSFYQVSLYDSTAVYAIKVLEEGPPNAGIKNAATLYQGKVEYAKGNYQGAIERFESTIDNAKEISAAEAQYLIGEVFHQQRKFKESNEVLFTMTENFSIYEYWLGMAFLLIANNYMAMEEYLQTRATLNSIIANTESGLIANLAKIKLDHLDEIDTSYRIEDADTILPDTVQDENR